MTIIISYEKQLAEIADQMFERLSREPRFETIKLESLRTKDEYINTIPFKRGGILMNLVKKAIVIELLPFEEQSTYHPSIIERHVSHDGTITIFHIIRARCDKATGNVTLKASENTPVGVHHSVEGAIRDILDNNELINLSPARMTDFPEESAFSSLNSLPHSIEITLEVPEHLSDAKIATIAKELTLHANSIHQSNGGSGLTIRPDGIKAPKTSKTPVSA